MGEEIGCSGIQGSEIRFEKMKPSNTLKKCKKCFEKETYL